MDIKIYFGDKPLFLTDELNKELAKLASLSTTIVTKKKSTSFLKSFIKELEQPEIKAGIIIGKDLEAIKKICFGFFTPIEAAGGLVVNKKNEILFIHRLGKWDLPKGKLEKGEAIEDCAIREVEEETCAKNLIIKNNLGETYHTYRAYGKYFIKTTYWFEIICSGRQNLKPQTIENITEIKWLAKDQLANVKRNTYPSIKNILKNYFSGQ